MSISDKRIILFIRWRMWTNPLSKGLEDLAFKLKREESVVNSYGKYYKRGRLIVFESHVQKRSWRPESSVVSSSAATSSAASSAGRVPSIGDGGSLAGLELLRLREVEPARGVSGPSLAGWNFRRFWMFHHRGRHPSVFGFWSL